MPTLKDFLAANKVETVVIGPVERYLMTRKKEDRRSDCLHPSEICKSDWCPRASYYRLSGREERKEEEISFHLQRIFEEGHESHAKWQTWLWNMGLLEGMYLCLGCDDHFWAVAPKGHSCGVGRRYLQYKEVPLENTHYNIAGHADGSVGPLIEIKGLALSTLLPTPTGWTTMQHVQVGDQLLGSSGAPCTVTAKSAPRQIKTYTVRFDDGTSVVCDYDHRWLVHTGPAWKVKTAVLTTDEIKDTLVGKNGQRQHRVLVPAPLDLPAVPLPIDPYVLGCWLGDGSFKNGSAFITKQRDLFDMIEAAGYRVGADNEPGDGCETRSVHGLAGPLRALGLAGKKSTERWVPREYLRASLDQRAALLQGLMDTDGTWVVGRERAKFGGVRCEQLALDVYELLLSMGQHPQVTEYWATGFGKRVRAWYVEWTPLEMLPFRRTAQAERVTSKRYPSMARRRMITAVEPGPEGVWTACVSVDSPDHTYLCTEHMIPTHNTVGIGTLRFEAPEALKEHLHIVEGGRKVYDLEALWKDIRRPFPVHIRQGNIYSFLRQEQDPTSDPRVVYIYDFKPNQAVKEFVVKYNRKTIEPILDACLDVKYALKVQRAPDRPSWTEPNHKVCTACPFQKHCWEIDDNEVGVGARQGGDSGQDETGRGRVEPPRAAAVQDPPSPAPSDGPGGRGVDEPVRAVHSVHRLLGRAVRPSRDL